MAFILYRKDIETIKPAIHWDTKNTSFTRIASVLKRMGIQNHTFHLSLLQPELREVDPFDPRLDMITKTKILYEAKINPWYFFRECLKVPIVGGDNIPFQLSRGNLAALWAFLNDIDFGLVMPRQTGKSYATQTIIAYCMYILADNITIGHFDKDQTNCANIIRVIKDIRNGMPSWMYERTAADTDRKESISYAKKHNTYLTFPSPIDERSAIKQGRGLTASILHFDEIAFINYNHLIVSTATNAMLKATEMARRAGIPSPIIYTTTAGNPDTESGKFALSIFENACPFEETMYDLLARDGKGGLVEMIGNNSKNHVLYLEFSYRQLGKSDEWFEQAARRSNASQDDINRDLLNIWQSSTDKCVIPKSLLALIRQSKQDPCFTDLSEGLAVRWYIPREEVESGRFAEQPMILGTDTSECVGKDFTTFTCISPKDGGVVFTGRVNDSNTILITSFVTNTLLKYPKMVWIPERQSTGAGIIDGVLDTFQKKRINPYFRIFNEVVQNYGDPAWKNVDVYDIDNLFGKARASFGYRTSGSGGTSRNLLYKQTMMKALELNHSRIRDSRLISELCGLEMRNGRVDHRKDGHDDQVISFLLASFLLFFGRNVRMYGLDGASLLSDLTASGESIDEYRRQEQISLRKRVTELEALMAGSSSSLMKGSYERELNSLRAMIDDSITIVQPLAVSQVDAQEKQIQQLGASGEQQLRNFSHRWQRAWNIQQGQQRRAWQPLANRIPHW